MTTLIFGILIGACFVLTIENTILIHRKPPKPVELTKEQKRKEDDEKRKQEEWDELMNYKGRAK